MTENAETHKKDETKKRDAPEQVIPLPWLTVEAALYILIALAALALRLYDLGGRPLQDSEASQALAAWRFYSGQAENLRGYSPLLLSGEVLAFTLFGANDFTARLIAALFGTALALLPYWLRHRLGRPGALVTSLLLALAPSALFLSRYAGGEIIVAVCAGAMVIGLFGYLEEKRPLYLYLLAAALALALCAGSAAYTVLFIFGTFFIFLALLHRLGRATESWSTITDAWRSIKGEREPVRNSAVLFVVVFVLACTLLLTNPAGLQASIDLFPAWLKGLIPESLTWHNHLQLLFTYEPFIVVFGLMGLVYCLVVRGSLFASFLIYWAMASIYIHTTAGPGAPTDVILSLLPLALLAGLFLGRFLEGVLQSASWGGEGLFLAIAGSAFVYLLFELSGYATSGQQAYLLLVVVAFLLPLGLLALYWVWFGQGVALRSGGLILLLVLGFFNLGCSWTLNYRPANDPWQTMIARPTAPGILDLLSTLEQVSAEREGDVYEIALAVEDTAKPLLPWYLRDFRQAHFRQLLDKTTAVPVIITSNQGERPALTESYSGQDFVLRSFWRPESLSGPNLVRWLLYRQAPTHPQEEKVILWVQQEQAEST